MTAVKRKLRPGRIVSMLAWTLAWLLITNVLWSAWAAWNDHHNAGPSSTSYLESDSSAGLYRELYYELRVLRCEERTTSYYEINIYLQPHGLTPRANPRPPALAQASPEWVGRGAVAELQRCDSLLATRNTSGQMNVSADFRATGWPVRLLWIGVQRPASPQMVFTNAAGTTRASRVRDTLIPRTGLHITNARLLAAGNDLYLPVSPIWTGQAFYAACWLGIVCIARLVHCRYRAWRGRCVHCNYDLRGNTTGVCPECGAGTGRDDK